MNYIFSQHALEQMKERGISEETVENILTKPDQITAY
jgi:predicted metal-dependent phosphotriesterase family hydrolase